MQSDPELEHQMPKVVEVGMQDDDQLPPPRRTISANTDNNSGSLKDILLYLRWLFSRKSLIWRITSSELQRTVLRSKVSYLWWLLDPLCNLLCYVVLVMALARGANSEIPYPLYIFSGLLPWTWMQGCMIGSTTIWTNFSAIIAQIRFPYMALILCRFLQDSVLYIISYVVLFTFCALYGYFPKASWLLLPVVIFVHSLLTLSLMFFCALTSFYFIDFRRLLPFLIRLWLFASPILYSLDMLPPVGRLILTFNPVTILFIGYRECLFYGNVFPVAGTLAAAVIFTLMLFLGVSIFIRKEPLISRYI